MNYQLLCDKYTSDGVVLVKNFVNENLLELVNKAIEYCETHPSPFSTKNLNKKGSFFYDYWTYKKNVPIQSLLSDNDLINKIKKITGNENLNFFHDHVLVKNEGAQITPWHHDRPYYFVDGPNNFSVWITPDDVEEDNSLAFCAGSHKSNNLYVPVNFEDKSSLHTNENLKQLDDKELRKVSSNGILIYKMKPGDAIFFHNRTLHRSLPSSKASKRRALSLRMLGDNSVLTNICAKNPQPPFEKFGMEIIEGASPEQKWFPKLPLNI
jgi:ectoine hydroxylase-related dioxygenase (phytanoyl-CoA dioxygenase family)